MEQKEATAIENTKTGDQITLKDEASLGQQPPKKKGKGGKLVLKIIIWLLVIGAVVFFTLFLAAKIGQFKSIGDMLRWIQGQI